MGHVCFPSIVTEEEEIRKLTQERIGLLPISYNHTGVLLSYEL